MAANKSAEKRVRTSEKARIRHKSRRSALKTSEKKFKEFVETSELDKAKRTAKRYFYEIGQSCKGRYYSQK